MVPGLEKLEIFISLLLATVITPVHGSYCYYSYYYYYYYCYYYYYYDVSGGAIAGAVIGALIGLACLIGLIVFCCVVVCKASTTRAARGTVLRPQPAVTVVGTGQPAYGYGYGQPVAQYQTYPAQVPQPPAYGTVNPAYPPPGGSMPPQPEGAVPPPPVYAENVVNGHPPPNMQHK